MSVLLDLALIERAKDFNFVSLWFQWMNLYLGELSAKRKLGYGYREGLFYPNGARKTTSHEEWPRYREGLSRHGLHEISIHALFCYEKYTSCQVFLDTGGIRFHSP